MSLRIVVDMNLSVEWVPLLEQAGWSAAMTRVVIDLPFHTSNHAIAVLKDIPMLQCGKCGEYLLEDAVMTRVDESQSGATRAPAR